MEVKEKLKLNIKSSLESLGLILDVAMIDIDNSKDINRGDYASNVALKNSKALGKNPRELANEIVNYLDMSEIEKAEIAGPGFINFFMKKDSLTDRKSVV